MKNPELFVKSVDTLVDAYERGNLEHLSPCHCAVGNLIAYNAGTYKFEEDGSKNSWSCLMSAMRENDIKNPTVNDKSLKFHFNLSNHLASIYQSFSEDKPVTVEEAFKQIEKTGYTATEIERIEAAFEKHDINSETGLGINGRGSHCDDPLDGLLKAISVLGDIHEISTDTVECMKTKISNKTYKKSFELEVPTCSLKN